MSNGPFLVAQLGARMHYAVPRILFGAAALDRLYTDFAANCGWPRLLNGMPKSVRPAAVQRLLGRVAEEIPARQITAFNLLGLGYARRLRRSRSTTESTAAFLWSGRKFCRQVIARGFGTARGVYTFNSAGLEILQAAKLKGLFAVMEQTIAPKRVERNLLLEEAGRFPDWHEVSGLDALADEYIQREEAEWHAADVILCGSEFVRDGIAQCGGPAERCVVVPYGVDGPKQRTESKKQKQGAPLRVLTVGAVGWRKGSPYVLEVARRMRGKATFRMVGHIGVSPSAQSKLREDVELMGVVPRSAIHEHFVWADVLLLPSICEGSATVTYEALANGLPVICSLNTGSVVRDGVDGFIVPARDVDAIVERLETLQIRPEFRTTLAANARARAAEFTIAAYGQRLLAALDVPFSVLGTRRFESA